MNCPYCGCETIVVDSRQNEDSVRRRRECAECKGRFSTIEVDIDYYKSLLDYHLFKNEERNIENETESCT